MNSCSCGLLTVKTCPTLQECVFKNSWRKNRRKEGCKMCFSTTKKRWFRELKKKKREINSGFLKLFEYFCVTIYQIFSACMFPFHHEQCSCIVADYHQSHGEGSFLKYWNKLVAYCIYSLNLWTNWRDYPIIGFFMSTPFFITFNSFVGSKTLYFATWYTSFKVEVESWNIPIVHIPSI